jgi:hypothetical protein
LNSPINQIIKLEFEIEFEFELNLIILIHPKPSVNMMKISCESPQCKLGNLMPKPPLMHGNNNPFPYYKKA